MWKQTWLIYYRFFSPKRKSLPRSHNIPVLFANHRWIEINEWQRCNHYHHHLNVKKTESVTNEKKCHEIFNKTKWLTDPIIYNQQNHYHQTESMNEWINRQIKMKNTMATHTDSSSAKANKKNLLFSFSSPVTTWFIPIFFFFHKHPRIERK